VQDLVTRGLISQEEALSHPQAHVLTKCLGAEPIIELEKKQFWIWQNGESEGDKLLLCSDGLYSLVSDEELAETVSKFSPQEACVSLVELAKERGGYDNITLAILPLKGELREECPDEVEQNDQPKIKTKSILVKARELSPSFWAKRLMITFFIFLIGGIVGTLMWLLHAMNA
jgi:serine/threonine protein phosphatase PrpC